MRPVVKGLNEKILEKLGENIILSKAHSRNVSFFSQFKIDN
jgi:hypothetical protein